VAKKEVHKGSKVAFGRGAAAGPELMADLLELLLRVAVQQRIAALIGILLPIERSIPSLERLDILPHGILARRGVGIHTHGLLKPVEVGNRRHVLANRAPGKPGLIKRDGWVCLLVLPAERPVYDVLHEKEEDLILGNGIAVEVLLAGAKVLA
jgi:hypothetical protein